MEAALASFAAAYGEWPYDAVYANNMATVFAAMGDYEQAWDRVVEALSVDPNLESARENLRVVGKRLRKHDEAEILLSMFGEDGCKGPEA